MLSFLDWSEPIVDTRQARWVLSELRKELQINKSIYDDFTARAKAVPFSVKNTDAYLQLCQRADATNKVDDKTRAMIPEWEASIALAEMFERVFPKGLTC